MQYLTVNIQDYIEWIQQFQFEMVADDENYDIDDDGDDGDDDDGSARDVLYGAGARSVNVGGGGIIKASVLCSNSNSLRLNSNPKIFDIIGATGSTDFRYNQYSDDIPYSARTSATWNRASADFGHTASISSVSDAEVHSVYMCFVYIMHKSITIDKILLQYT